MIKRFLPLFFAIFIFPSGICSQVSTELEQFIQIDGEEFHFTDYGHGDEVILCLHGFALSSLSFRQARPFFDSTKYRILALDLKGFGFSAKPKKSDYSLERQAYIVQLFMKAKGVQQAHLVGHSYGGMVCLFLNYKKTKETLGFEILTTSLMDTPAYNKHLPFFMKAIMTKVGAFLVLKAPPLAIKTRIAINGGFHRYQYGVSEYLEIYKKLLRQREYPNSMQQAASQVLPKNFEEITTAYKSIDIPVLVMWGEHDNFIDRRHAYGLIESISNSRLVIIEGTSHNPHEEKPEVVYNLIRSFIEEN